MQNAGTALMGIGESSNPDTRAIDAARAAIHSPLLDYSIDGAKGVLITIRGSYNLSMVEVSEAVEVVKQYVDPNAQIKMGVIIDEKSTDNKDKVSVTVLATGFPHGPKLQDSTQANLTGIKTTSHQASPLQNSRDISDTDSIHSAHSPQQGNDSDDTYLDTPAFMRRRQIL